MIPPEPQPRNVASRGKMVDGVYRAENTGWYETLTEVIADCGGKGGVLGCGCGRVGCHRAGRNPMTIPVETLIAAGHGPRPTQAIMTAIDCGGGKDDIRRYKDIRRFCEELNGDPTTRTLSPSVRYCRNVDCAAWAYRFGRNPHSPRRGKNPFAKAP